MLRVLNNSGFQLELSNNLTVSVMFDVHNDCARKDTTEFLKRLDKIKNKDFVYPDDNWESKNASVAVFLTSAESSTHINVPGYKYYSGERSLGWVPAHEVANIISKVSKMRLKDIAENLVKEPLTQPAKTFKVVINNCFGGFGLSNAAKYELGEAGLNVEDRFSRHDPRLVEVVERLGDAANSKYADLKVVDLEGETQYFITEYDGSESVWTPKTAPWKGDA